MPKYAHPRRRTSGGPGELFSGNAARLVARLRPMAGRAASQVRDATHIVGLGLFFGGAEPLSLELKKCPAVLIIHRSFGGEEPCRHGQPHTPSRLELVADLSQQYV